MISLHNLINNKMQMRLRDQKKMKEAVAAKEEKEKKDQAVKDEKQKDDAKESPKK